MRAIGLILLTVGFLVGSYIASMSEENLIRWKLFVPVIVVAAIGVALARFGGRKAASEESQLGSRMEILEHSLAQIVQHMETLDNEKDGVHPYALHSRIDELFPVHLNAFVDSRQTIAHHHGLEAYANVMNEFAAGERYLNRVWSASVDCYVDEAREYVGRAREQFNRAHRLLVEL